MEMNRSLRRVQYIASMSLNGVSCTSSEELISCDNRSKIALTIRQARLRYRLAIFKDYMAVWSVLTVKSTWPCDLLLGWCSWTHSLSNMACSLVLRLLIWTACASDFECCDIYNNVLWLSTCPTATRIWSKTAAAVSESISVASNRSFLEYLLSVWTQNHCVIYSLSSLWAWYSDMNSRSRTRETNGRCIILHPRSVSLLNEHDIRSAFQEWLLRQFLTMLPRWLWLLHNAIVWDEKISVHVLCAQNLSRRKMLLSGLR